MNINSLMFVNNIKAFRSFHKLYNYNATIKNPLIEVTRLLATKSVNIFNRQTKFLQRERAAFDENVHVYDYLKEEVGYRLSDRIFDIKKTFNVAVDFGCGRGYISKNVSHDNIEKLIMCDMSSKMLDQAHCAEGLVTSKHTLQDDYLHFEESSIDLVLSSMYLHWINDLPGCFKSILKSLKPDGVFMAALLGGDTLYELRSSLQLAELERRGGISAHISPFAEARDIGSLLTQAGFVMLTIDTDEIIVGYPTMFELLNDLKGMAENNAAWNRPLHLHRDTLLAASSIYKEMYGKENGVPATFQIVYLVGWKPSPDQPQPLPRGSATESFKNLGKISHKMAKS
ncbi:arginine-hydroxylase NDUFAF5, mitochondrial-like [Ctenocephalides felis]|uniref:arginine-hydroxylase NDUFAF5, mitochondrial-like n=1 Tax=Ctenocephalides felis TaxID=7515 RepID=UPI000E6E4710|nr:arginine-hydroxylase NDUFAF5, mitochondrial-like [Ctenocephalides felis]